MFCFWVLDVTPNENIHKLIVNSLHGVFEKQGILRKAIIDELIIRIQTSPQSPLYGLLDSITESNGPDVLKLSSQVHAYANFRPGFIS